MGEAYVPCPPVSVEAHWWRSFCFLACAGQFAIAQLSGQSKFATATVTPSVATSTSAGGSGAGVSPNQSQLET